MFVYLLRILFAKPEINRPDVFAEPPVSHSTDCQPCTIIRTSSKFECIRVEVKQHNNLFNLHISFKTCLSCYKPRVSPSATAHSHRIEIEEGEDSTLKLQICNASSPPYVLSIYNRSLSVGRVYFTCSQIPTIIRLQI